MQTFLRGQHWQIEAGTVIDSPFQVRPQRRRVQHSLHRRERCPRLAFGIAVEHKEHGALVRRPATNPQKSPPLGLEHSAKRTERKPLARAAPSPRHLLAEAPQPMHRQDARVPPEHLRHAVGYKRVALQHPRLLRGDGDAADDTPQRPVLPQGAQPPARGLGTLWGHRLGHVQALGNSASEGILQAAPHAGSKPRPSAAQVACRNVVRKPRHQVYFLFQKQKPPRGKIP